MIINENGQLVNFSLTKGNVDDRKPVKKLAKNLSGLMVEDRGYVYSKLKYELSKHNLKVITNVRKNMKKQNIFSNDEKKLLSKKRIIETIIGQLKIKFSFIHARFRSRSRDL